MNFLRAATGRSGLLTATGQVIHSGRQQAVAEGRLSDESGRLVATASTTCLVFDLPEVRKQGPTG
ncbi:MAG TPA: PaaI family thioesterase [Methylorubrum populi]|uniref:PaaI family thioesterase n=1 Tax=Methylorubrum populi TaxID=223967 RepID=A0A921JGF8_9HYPH|nr:PaaI family thioesterase [Methylorubrum populi]